MRNNWRQAFTLINEQWLIVWLSGQRLGKMRLKKLLMKTSKRKAYIFKGKKKCKIICIPQKCLPDNIDKNSKKFFLIR